MSSIFWSFQDVQKMGKIGDFLVYIGMRVIGPGYSLSCLHRLSSFTSFDLSLM